MTLEKIIAEATPGPWIVGNLLTLNSEEYPGLGFWWLQIRSGEDAGNIVARVYGDDKFEIFPNAQFIAAARTALPAALALIREMKSALHNAEDHYCDQGTTRLEIELIQDALDKYAAFEKEFLNDR